MNRLWSWEQAITKSGLDASTRLLLFTLATYMDKHGKSCFPSIPEIAKASGLKERTVSKHIKIAKNKGWLVISKRRMNGNKWDHNFYEAAWPEPEKQPCLEGVHQMQGVHETAKGGAPDADYQSNYQSNDINIGEAFDRLWDDINPRLPRARRIDKAKAKAKLISIAKTKGMSLDKLINAIACYYREQSHNDNFKYASSIYRCLTGGKYEAYFDATIHDIDREQKGGRNVQRSFKTSRPNDASQRRASEQERRRQAARKLDEQFAGGHAHSVKY